MHAAIQGTIGILYEAGFADGTIGAQKNRNRIGCTVVAGRGELRVHLRAGTTDVGLGAALKATLPIERRSQTKQRGVAGRVVSALRSHGGSELYEPVNPEYGLLDGHVGDRMARAAGRRPRPWARIKHAG